MRGPFGEACNSFAIIGNQHANGKEMCTRRQFTLENISVRVYVRQIFSCALHDLCILGYQVGDKQVVNLTRVER